MKIIIKNSKKGAYEIMSNIMKGSYDRDELIKFLSFSKLSLFSKNVLEGYLEAICGSATYRIDTSFFDKPIIDIVGTGGDNKKTVNISTLASLICAATDLVYVAKYGNRSASGICGSMDVLEALGVNIKLSKKNIIQQLKAVNFVPLYAREIYPGGRFVAEARRLIGKPTIFNLLFPLAYPTIGKQRFIFGCATLQQMKVFEKIFFGKKNVRCLIVHGVDYTDEISISGNGKTKYTLIDEDNVKRGVIDCRKIFGITPINLKLLQISTKEEAINVFKSAINPKIKTKKIEAIRNAGFINAAAALFIALDDMDMDISKANKYFSLVQEVLQNGIVLRLVNDLALGKENL